jgi:uncharacterized protein YukE
MAAETSVQYDGLTNYAQKLQEYSDNTASLMQNLANHVAAVAPGFQGQAAIAMNNAHEYLNAQVAKHTTAFADASHSANNSVQVSQNQEEQSAHIIAGVSQMT